MLWVIGQPQSRETHATPLFWQRISVLLQRFNAILTTETFVEAGDASDLSVTLFLTFFSF